MATTTVSATRRTADDADPDLSFVDTNQDGGGYFDEDDGIPGSEPVDVDAVDPDQPAQPEPPANNPVHHEPKGPAGLPGTPSQPPGEDAPQRPGLTA